MQKQGEILRKGAQRKCFTSHHFYVHTSENSNHYVAQNDDTHTEKPLNSSRLQQAPLHPGYIGWFGFGGRMKWENTLECQPQLFDTIAIATRTPRVPWQHPRMGGLSISHPRGFSAFYHAFLCLTTWGGRNVSDPKKNLNQGVQYTYDLFQSQGFSILSFSEISLGERVNKNFLKPN